ncbi:MAG TPA: hypothetical protein VGC06_23065, partial [Actinomycetes bacterium]
MKARCYAVALLALALVLIAAPAAMAKGATALRITGPGLDKPISLRGLGEPGTDTALAEISDDAGLFAVMFGDDGGRLSAERPAGELGPRYTIAYSVPGDGGTYRIVQDLYPWAAAGPFTYAKPGQRLWGGQGFVGGWFRTPLALLPVLKSVGFPARPSTAPKPVPAAPIAASPAAATVAPDQRSAWPVAATAAGITMVALVGGVLAVRAT